MAKTFRTSCEALCIFTGISPIIIKAEGTVQKYIVRKGKESHTHLIDSEVELKNWPHLADAVKITETKEYKEQTIQAYTDRSKNVHGVGSAVAIFVVEELVAQLKYKLNNGCSNNQEEHLPIAKALQIIESQDISENSPRTVTIFTNSRIALDSLKNVNYHGYLIEEIRRIIHPGEN